MVEVWKDIPEFPGYQVSNTGKIRSFWQKKKKFGTYGGTERILTNIPHELSQSDDGNGYCKVFLRNGDVRRCVKVHRLVAENYIPRINQTEDTVDHIVSGLEGKKDNSVNNLRWISRRDNIKKAYKDGICDRRIESQKKDILITDLTTNRKIHFYSVGDAARFIGKHYTTISHALNKDIVIAERYIAETIEGEDRLIYCGGDFDENNYHY